MAHDMGSGFTFSIHAPEDEVTRNFMGAYDRPSICLDCQQANCDKCFQFGDDATCVCVAQGLHGLPTSEARGLEDPMFDIYADYAPALGIDIPNNGHPHPFTVVSPEHEHFQLVSSNPSSEGSYMSTPPSPNPGDIPDNHPQDWNYVMTYKTFRNQSGDSHSSAHGDEASNGPESANGSPHELYTPGGSTPSYGSRSPHLSEFGDLTIDSDVKSFDFTCLPSPELLSPDSGGIGRSSSFTLGGVRRGHSRSISTQSISTQLSDDGDQFGPNYGRGRGLVRTRSVPATRRHSPYASHRDNLEAGPSASPHLTGSSAESLQDAVVKDVVTTEKTKMAAERRRKNPPAFVCQVCAATFTTKFKRDRHVQAHQGVKPFMCAFKGCGKTFSSQSDTMRHEKTSKMHEHERELALGQESALFS